MSPLRVGVLFAGGGGSAVGHRMAGDEVVYVCERWESAIGVLRLNFPDAELGTDVMAVRGEELSGLDVLDASPPCQDFSQAGNRDLNGNNAWLLHEVPRIARRARPRAVTIENVPGLRAGRARVHLDVLMEELGEAGYRAEWRELDSSMLGVAQKRKRLLVVGIRDDLDVDPGPAFPHHLDRRTVMSDALPEAAAIVRLPREIGDLEHIDYRTGTRWLSSRPAPTMTTSGFSGGDRSTDLPYARIELADGSLRPVTVEDGKALMGFPEEYEFPDDLSVGARWKMLGNAVPPPMARAWAESVGRALSGAGGDD